MKSFNQETEGYKNCKAYKALKTFFDIYLLERDYDKTRELFEDDYYGIATGTDEIFINNEELSKKLSSEIKIIPESVIYRFEFVNGKEIAENIWDYLAQIEIVLPSKGNEKSICNIRFTGCFRVFDEGFKVISTHISDASNITKKSEIFDIMSKSIPGGIICGYAKKGFPVYFVNEFYLEMLGYSSYDEYFKDAKGMGINHIHPDDVDMVNEEIMSSYNSDTQYGIEYRIRHKDGHYIPVYDIGRKMITPDNKEYIVCVLYDMTENVKLREILLKESSYDVLTGAYNRGRGVKIIENIMNNSVEYSFAFFDIDNLKLINDIYNHIAGDNALKHFAKLINKNLDENAIFVRVGGDEFVVFFKNKIKEQDIERIFKRIEKEYCRYIENNYKDSCSSVSIGCVIGSEKRNFDELYRIADKLMYDIKKNGKRGYKILELD